LELVEPKNSNSGSVVVVVVLVAVVVVVVNLSAVDLACLKQSEQIDSDSEMVVVVQGYVVGLAWVEPLEEVGWKSGSVSVVVVVVAVIENVSVNGLTPIAKIDYDSYSVVEKTGGAYSVVE
jgi:hypothetical protein